MCLCYLEDIANSVRNVNVKKIMITMSCILVNHQHCTKLLMKYIIINKIQFDNSLITELNSLSGKLCDPIE